MSKSIWLFFDIGSTLIDETECYNHRIRDAIEGTDITFEQFNEKRIFFAKQNLKSDVEAIKFFGLTKTSWHTEDMKPYPEAENVLKTLSEQGYNIGIIANQSLGTQSRLESWGLMKYIRLVAASAEEGVAKPDKEIFLRALSRAECPPENSFMIGDRLDNDIEPAKRLGMKTIWVKQGFNAYQQPVNEFQQADYAVEGLRDILEVLL
ncbi:HAD family hydrolase [Ruminococcus sp. Marseille-P6503]|uniref:HAD family hydrolase n=1 Tax=Ruminococcus sp. Marseille-P6503 TaxID=2364796 RepID=UPI000F524DFB|nr:HAD family hydrolase [Ruminococcus sp. Marseille-P6503]